MHYHQQLHTGPTRQDRDVGVSPDKAPLYCHWDTHCEDYPLASQSEFDLHLKSHFANHHLANSDFTDGVACHWDSCHETFLSVDSMMSHWQNYHYQGSFRPHYAENTCPEFDLGQEHSVLSGVDSAAPIDASHSHNCQHVHKDSSAAHGFVRIHDGESSLMERPDLSNLPDLAPSTRSPSLSSPPDSGLGDVRCQWVVNGEMCNHVFSTTAELKDHVESMHVASRQRTYYCGWAGCERCERPFPQRQKLLRHLQVHTRHRDCKCHICNRLFAEESVLKQHMRTHSGEKPFECTYCNKCFSSISALTVHKRVHTGEKPLVCKVPGCGKRFSESSNLAKHMKTHAARAFGCEVCQRKFARRDQLVRHMRTHKTWEAPAEPAEVSRLSALPSMPLYVGHEAE